MDLTHSTLPAPPGSIPGLAAIYFKEKGEKECWII
jgi:hypothetical protein